MSSAISLLHLAHGAGDSGLKIGQAVPNLVG
jgi:hypothetical protein